MYAMVLNAPRHPLVRVEREPRALAPGEVLIRVHACAVCRTDLHVVDGELSHPKLPLVPGHEAVGEVIASNAAAESIRTGTRVGVPWLGWTCGECAYCRSEQENLCERAEFTGYTRDGGFAEYLIADAPFCLPIPESFSSVAAAPLLCAGLIGYRCLRRAGNAQRLGLYGFGAAAHLLTQVARFEGREVFAFTRSGDRVAQDFARELGAVWSGGSDSSPPKALDAAIIFAPVGGLVPCALRAVRKGGTVVCGGIHMSDIPAFPYELLWQERTLTSVANLTRRDGVEFLDLAPKVSVKSVTEELPLSEANTALNRLRSGEVRGALVLVP